MKLLLVHQNFPGQYRYLAAAMRNLPGARIVALGDADNLEGVAPPAGIERLAYRPGRAPTPGIHPYLKQIEAAVLRGQAVLRQAQELRRRGFVPDLICVHAAWGEALYLRDVFPRSRILAYFEFYYRGHGADVGYDPEFPATLDDRLRVRTWNMVHESSYFAVDWGVSPTAFQASMFPPEMRQRLSVVHDGIDTRALRPDSAARVTLPGGLTFDRATDEVVTFVSRGLEPYRGFHIFMRALPELQRRCPRAQVVIVGRDIPSYGRAPGDAPNWRVKMLRELDGRIDLARVHFVGTLPYPTFTTLLQVSRAHVYLTYPFVLSWSLLEAMALGAPIAASATPPVREVVAHGTNGLLFDFFDPSALVDAVHRLLTEPDLGPALAAAARATVVDRYDLQAVCLPAQARLLQGLVAHGHGRLPDPAPP